MITRHIQTCPTCDGPPVLDFSALVESQNVRLALARAIARGYIVLLMQPERRRGA